MRESPIRRFRIISLLEGASFLFLLGIAMPLKYVAGMPLAVKYAGWAHGLLFLGFLATLGPALSAAGWPLRRGALFLLGSLLPFGPFLMDRSLRRAELEARQG